LEAKTSEISKQIEANKRLMEETKELGEKKKRDMKDMKI